MHCVGNAAAAKEPVVSKSQASQEVGRSSGFAVEGLRVSRPGSKTWGSGF